MADYLGTQVLTGITQGTTFRQGVTPWGHARVKSEATQLFIDTFNSSIDTVNKWNISNGGGGVLPAYSTASATLNSGTTANGFSLMSSKLIWQPSEPAFLEWSARVNIEFPVLTSGYRFFGLANTPASPTIAAPITDGVGFEVFTDGKLYAVTYAAGARNVIADLSVATGNGSQPQNGNAHKYYITFRPDMTFWAIDQPDNYVAVFATGALGPNNNALANTNLAVSNGSPAVTIVNNGTSVSDTGRNGVQPYLWNGFSVEPQRSNTDTNTALINAAAVTTSQTGADQINTNGRGLIVVLNMATVGTGSVTLTIQGKDVVSGQYYTLLAGAAVTTNSVNVYTVYPGAPATANVSANSPLPRTWRVITTANNANATTYTVGASVIV